MEPANKPSGIAVSSAIKQPTIDITDDTITATLPSGESVTVYLYGATVTSWKLADGKEQLFLSEKAVLDGSKAIRGGIPLVFPVFGPPPPNHATSSLPQHGFARTSTWEFLGKSSSESSTSSATDDGVKLDFGLSHTMLSEESRKAWGWEFGLVFSVTLGRESLETSMRVQNSGDKGFEFQNLFHSYLRLEDVTDVSISSLKSTSFIDKINKPSTTTPISVLPTESSSSLSLSSTTDRVYAQRDTSKPILVSTSSGTPKFAITTDGLPDVVVWNPWKEGAPKIGDFGPADGWKNMLCVEPGHVYGWVKLEAGETWEGKQTVRVGKEAEALAKL